MGLKHHKDTIIVARSDYDPHGFSQSLFGMLGYRPVHAGIYEIEVPFGACVPQKTDNLIICFELIEQLLSCIFGAVMVKYVVVAQ
jgi:hypothetical protein